jgi:hypothetical protein
MISVILLDYLLPKILNAKRNVCYHIFAALSGFHFRIESRESGETQLY